MIKYGYLKDEWEEFVTFWVRGSPTHEMSISVRNDQYEAILSSIRENEQRERKRES